jgi:hypothetical protein
LYATAVYQLAESIAGRDAQLAQATAQATAMPAAQATVPAGATPP